MSYLPVPSPVLPGPPGLTDDGLKGYIEGSTVIDGSVSPRAAHICVDPTPGSAMWRPMGAAAGLTNGFTEDVTVYPISNTTPVAVESPVWS